MENFLFISFGTFDKNSSVMQRWITNGIEWRGLFFAKRRRVAVPCTRYIHIVARKKKGGGGWARNRRIRIRFTSIQKSASSRSREENSLCMQSRDGEEHPDAAEVWFLTKEGAFYRLNTIKITDGGVQWSKSRCRKRGGKKKKKEKALYGKQSGSFQRTKEREKFRENNGTDFISPWYPPPCLAFYARFDRPVRFLVTFPPDQWNIFAGKCSFFLTKFRRNSSSIFPEIMVE